MAYGVAARVYPYVVQSKGWLNSTTSRSSPTACAAVRRNRGSQRIRPRRARGTVYGLLGPNGAARPRPYGSSPRCCGPTAAGPRSPASTWPAGRAGRAADRAARPERGRRRGAQRQAEPGDVRPALPSRRPGGPRPGGRTAGGASGFRHGPQARQPVLRRHAQPPRPGRQPDPRTAGALPGRTDDRARPARARRGVDAPSGAGRPGTTCCSPPSTWRRPISSPTDRACSTRGGCSPRAPRTGSSPDRRRSDRRRPARTRADLPAAAALLVGRPAVPGKSTRTPLVSAPVRDRMAALTEVVRGLDDGGITAEDIALRRPTLEEVFLHLTGDRGRRGAPAPSRYGPRGAGMATERCRTAIPAPWAARLGWGGRRRLDHHPARL